MSEAVRTTAADGILEVVLDRPKANAIDSATSRALGSAFAAFRDDPGLRVAIVTGGGEKFFSAGWDLKAAAEGGERPDTDYGVGGFGGLQELPDLNKPVIAALNGMTVGGGFELALSCDLILAAEHVRFGLPEINAGTLADAATIKLPRRIPFHVAMDLLLTGRWMEVGRGQALGPGQRDPARRPPPAARPRDRAAAGRRPAAGVRRDQGDPAPDRGPAVPGGHGPRHPEAAADGQAALRERGPARRSAGVRREAQAGLAGQINRPAR